MVHLQKIRSDQLQSVDTVVQKDSSDDEDKAPPEEDEFDKLLQQQIELARATPAPESAKKPPPANARHIMSPFTMPKATSSPSISDEQKERMLRNRKLAEERRLARLKQNTSHENLAVGTIKLNTLHERMSNANEHSDSSDEEHHANVSVSVQINTSSNYKGTENNANEDEIMYDNVDEQGNGQKEVVEQTNTKRTSVNSSTHTENTLDCDNTIMNNSLKELQRNGNEIDVEHSTPEINGDISANVLNRHQETIEVLHKDVNEITNGKHKDQMNEERTSLTNEETCNNLEITKDDTPVKEVENDCDDNKFKNTSSDKSIEKVTEEIVKVNEESAEMAENEQNEKVNTVDTIQNAEIDKLVESELMDVDFDDDF
ncbi:hypothetical protein O3G_MSEX002849 [Manduca sexta]|nr:hypothetical protein O3G_MSEX002849 [Manduca sexta]KAG6443458.1 hypothetical protein O3G_MSEX002849 [Manduca sexta]